MTSVLLYSGGMDSFILKELLRPDVVLFVKTGTQDNKDEYDIIAKQKIPNLRIVDMSFLAKFEMPNKIVPFRNAFLALVAANFGNEIYIGATFGDTTKDKDYVFSGSMETFLNHFAEDTNKVWEEEYPYKIKMPFKQMTKREILAEYLRLGLPIDRLIKNSRSCYKSGKECGTCRSCLRKQLAFARNDIDYKPYFETDGLSNMSKEDKKYMLARKGEGEDLKKWLRQK